jgi:hypothetical protein
MIDRREAHARRYGRSGLQNGTPVETSSLDG